MCGYKAMTRPRSIMDNSLFFEIIDQYISQGPGALGIVGTGEPLMDPELFRKIEYAAEKGLNDVITFTNGSLLSGENIKQILNSKLKKIFVSIDGFSKEEYESIRLGLRWDEVLNNLFNLLRANQKMKEPIDVELRAMLLSKKIDASKKTLIKEMKKLGAIVTLSNFEAAHNWACQIKFGNFEQRRYYKYMRLPCYRLWSGMQILWNGDVALCCIDYDGKIILGNVKDGLDRVWSGETLKKMRNAHLNEEIEKLGLCKYCRSREPWPK